MSESRTSQIYLFGAGLLCLAALFLLSPFGRLTKPATPCETEGTVVAPSLATVPYRRLITFSIPDGAGDAVGSIPDVPSGKKLTIEFAAMRAALPSSGQSIKAGVESIGGTFVPFVMTDQGNYGGYQHFVASQPMNLIYESGGMGKGVYAHRKGTSGVANIQAYIVGQLEQ